MEESSVNRALRERTLSCAPPDNGWVRCWVRYGRGGRNIHFSRTLFARHTHKRVAEIAALAGILGPPHRDFPGARAHRRARVPDPLADHERDARLDAVGLAHARGEGERVRARGVVE